MFFFPHDVLIVHVLGRSAERRASDGMLRLWKEKGSWMKTVVSDGVYKIKNASKHTAHTSLAQRIEGLPTLSRATRSKTRCVALESECRGKGRVIVDI